MVGGAAWPITITRMSGTLGTAEKIDSHMPRADWVSVQRGSSSTITNGVSRPSEPATPVGSRTAS